MKNIVLALAAVSTLAAGAAPAEAQYHRGGNTTTSAILGVAAGAALGVGISALVHQGQNRRVQQQAYQPQPYPAQPYVQPYQQPAQPAYQAQSYQPQPFATYDQRPAPRPAPNGVRCLVWNGFEYAPTRC